jgi:hypothetical protein
MDRGIGHYQKKLQAKTIAPMEKPVVLLKLQNIFSS